MSGLIRHITGIPTATHFASATGTPMIIDTNSGIVYVITDGGVVTPVGTGAGVEPSNGDKGDITVSAAGLTWTIDNSVVTTAKMGGDVTTAGKALLDDADASAQRTTLGLGTLATQSGTFSGTSSGTNTGDQDLSALAPKASPTFTGTVTIPTPFTLGAVSVLPTGTELNFVDGVTSGIQGQLDLKAPLASPTFTGTVTIPTPFTLGAVSVLPTGTELNFVDGVTSGIQGQINEKQATLISGTNIKTINGSSVLGAGDLVVSSTPSLARSFALIGA